jgi:hypothetical protein
MSRTRTSAPAPSTPTPGIDRTVQFFVRGNEFRFRLPTRADNAEILRRYTAKLMRACPPLGDLAAQEVAKETLGSLDGGGLLSEARLEVLLLPRAGAAALGEHAPAHWLREVKDPDGTTVIARSVAFDDVDPDEFDEVARFVDDQLAQKKSPSPNPSSTDTARDTTSA